VHARLSLEHAPLGGLAGHPVGPVPELVELVPELVAEPFEPDVVAGVPELVVAPAPAPPAPETPAREPPAPEPPELAPEPEDALVTVPPQPARWASAATKVVPKRKVRMGWL
jgi:hypothetical protein